MIESMLVLLGFILMAIALPPMATVGITLILVGFGLSGVRKHNEAKW